MQLPRFVVRLIDPVTGHVAQHRRPGRPIYRGGAVYGPSVPGGSRQARPEEILHMRTRAAAHRERRDAGLAALLPDHRGELEAMAVRLAATRAASATIDGVNVSATIRRFWHGDDLLTIEAHSEHGRHAGRSRLRRKESANSQRAVAVRAKALRALSERAFPSFCSAV